MSASPFDLSGKVAIVTGGNGGIGLGMALGLAQAGARIAIAARRADKAEAAMAALKEAGAGAMFVATDVGDRGACQAMADAVVDRFGRIDILVNNAGMVAGGRSETLSVEDWQRTLDVNLGGPFYCAQACHPHMKAAGGGKIINIGSIYSIFGPAFAAPYGATKGGIVQLTKALAAEWARDDIQVNAVLPGWIETDMGDYAKERAGHEQAVIKRTPARRWGVPADLAGIAVFLASAASDFITGTAIPVDGGYSVEG